METESNRKEPSTRRRRGVKRRHLPPGSGPYTVGTVDVMYEHSEEGAFFRLYYPTSNTDIFEKYKQWPLWLPRREYGLGYVHFLGKNPKVFGKLFNWLGGDVYVPAVWQAPMLRNGREFPVIVLSHGLGGNRTTYTTFCCNLASHGFVVAALEHRDGSACVTVCLRESSQHKVTPSIPNEQHDIVNNNNNNTSSSSSNPSHHHHHSHNPLHHLFHHRHTLREEWKYFDKPKSIRWDDYTYRNKQMHHRARECCKVLDILTLMTEGHSIHNSYSCGVNFDTAQFKNTLDISKASIIGHSFGGATCVTTLSEDPRFKVGVMLDAWMLPLDDDIAARVSQPLLMVNMETFHWKKNIEQMKRLETSDVERHMITIKGACHQSVSDFQFLTNKVIGRLMEVRHTLAPAKAMDISSRGAMAFLRKHLGMAEADIDAGILSGENKYVIQGTNVDLS